MNLLAGSGDETEKEYFEKGDVGSYLHKSYRRIVCLTADKETPDLAQEVCNRYSARGTTLDMGGGDYIISDIFGK